ncbi:TPA: hypothetical protein P2Q91_002720 [Aeromonas veronii]|uniref:hypothetical protein n=1 Tax=Aeromonas veronii TaxID=654 RepID=UPI003310ABE2|nr:hypothetical protein [Aeromonas veronii]HDO1338253.1 hypothetical protein [Aeromonas veronii]HDO1342038.1 hypothetical protein [Aeromonas veronii]HDO1348150.1 hypothetical protein [Aeromonas veronii]HDO1352310.1 hypothetical protein [Aeromonas veronii]
MKQLVPLLTLALTAPSAMASSPNDIWSYQDSDGVTLAQACNNKSTCEPLYKNRHYVALVNNRSQTGCAIGDLFVAEHASRSFKKLDTGTCSPSASIEVNTYNRLNNVDVMVGDRLIKRYPLDTWMYLEERKEGKVASWSKAEENAKKPQTLNAPKGPPAQWVAEEGRYGLRYTLTQGQGYSRYVLEIKCAYQMPGATWPLHSELRYTSAYDASSTVEEIEVDGQRLSGKSKSQAEWTELVNAILSASTLSIYRGQDQKATWTVKPTKLTSTCDYYNG